MTSKNKILYFCFLILFLFLNFVNSEIGWSKPFRRVLVLSGGGLNPGTPLGLIHGVVSMGWKPDLIISTCGSSVGSMLYNGSTNIEQNLKDLYSEGAYRGYNSVEITNSWVWDLKSVIDRANNLHEYPEIFSDLLLYVPQKFPIRLKNEKFLNQPNDLKLIFVASKALFGPSQVGQTRTPVAPLFKTIFFTDNSTAQYLKNYKLQNKNAYPNSNVIPETETETRFTTVDAFRASIADPFLLNPYIFKGSSYFTGAINLFSLDMALELGDEVIATYPKGLFDKYENAAIRGTFGFNQNNRVLEAIQHDDVKWIDVWGADELSFNPVLSGLTLISTTPTDRDDFEWSLKQQYQFGFQRAQEALMVRPPYSIKHLRKPISKALFKEFICKNAYAWKTSENEYCENDNSDGCNRNEAEWCTPLR